jgi:heptaprenyl diphosphate synthase
VVPASPLLALPSMEADLGRIELSLRRAVATTDDYLTELASHLIAAGGKRLRPVMAVAASLTKHDHASDEVIEGGTSVELVQVGSLYHDDVIDEAEMRRGVPSVNALWGNHRAILSGDFLLARASEIAASLGAEVAGLLGNTIGRLVQGQIAELTTQNRTDRTVAQYLASIDGKTASLFSAAARIGGIVSDLSRPTVDALTTCGQAFGMVFQIVDDILDLTKTEAELGKPAGHDIVEGVFTLPVLHTLAQPGSAADELCSILSKPVDDVGLARALVLVRSGSGLPHAVGIAREYAAAGEAAMEPYSDTAAGRALAQAGHALIDSILAG